MTDTRRDTLVAAIGCHDCKRAIPSGSEVLLVKWGRSCWIALCEDCGAAFEMVNAPGGDG